MLRRMVQMNAAKLRPTRLFMMTRQLSSSSTKTTTANKLAPEAWDLYASVLVERLPVVSQPLSQFEQQFQDLLWRVELEKSLKSEHELQYERELTQAELIRKGKLEIDLEETSSKQTAQDLKDAHTEELKKFQFASRTTPDDTASNVVSTNRSLEDTLYLLVDQQLGQRSHLLLPQGQRRNGETMRQTAERVLRETCGEQLQVDFAGNAPCGFYKYKYPSTMRERSVGAKVFFFRAALRHGNVDKSRAQHYEWLVKDALNRKLQNTNYAESINRFLL